MSGGRLPEYRAKRNTPASGEPAGRRGKPVAMAEAVDDGPGT